MSTKSEGQGGPQRKFVQQGILLPPDLHKAFKTHVGRMGDGSVKIAGTAAIAVYMGLPEKVREALYLAVLKQSWEGADAVTPESVIAILKSLVGDEWNKGRSSIVREVPLLQDDGKPPEPKLPGSETHFVDRIIDPHAKGVKPPKKRTGSGD